MEHVQILGTEDKNEGALHKMWGGMVQFTTDLFKNEPQDQVAARVPMSGTINNPKAGLLATIGSVFRNAFVAAFAHSLEGSISLRDVKKNLSELDVNAANGEHDKGAGKKDDGDKKNTEKQHAGTGKRKRG
jgi:hypothetical protein